jgi:hypothetical protein
MRGGAIKTADDQSRFGLGIRELDNNRALSGVRGANALLKADIQSKADYDTALERLQQQKAKADQDAIKGFANTLASVLSFGIMDGVVE